MSGEPSGALSNGPVRNSVQLNVIRHHADWGRTKEQLALEIQQACRAQLATSDEDNSAPTETGSTSHGSPQAG